VTNEKLRDAAERMVSALYCVNELLGTVEVEGPLEMAVRFAKIWLAEHPEDDDEPITFEWLDSVGFLPYERSSVLQARWFCIKEETDQLNPSVLFVYFDSKEGFFFNLGDADDRVCMPGICRQPTRRHVRRLVEALGGELKK
jgi:hypothetical protein